MVKPEGNIPLDKPRVDGIKFSTKNIKIDPKTINPLGSPQGRHFDNGRTILPQGSPQGRHLQSPLGKGSLRKSPLESKVNQSDRKEFDLIHNKIDTIQKNIDELKQEMSYFNTIRQMNH